MTDGEILAEMRRQHALWLESRRIGRSRILLLCFTILLSIFHIMRPQFISPFQHGLTGWIVAKTNPFSIVEEMNVRSLWRLNALIFFKTAVQRCNPFHEGDRAFMSRMETTFKAFDVDDRSTYGAHVTACLETLPGVNPDARRLLACHVQLLGHAVPPLRLRSLLPFRRRGA